MKMRVGVCFILVLLCLWANNTSVFVADSAIGSATKVIAHRGVHQVYAGNNKTANTCRAEAVEPIEHQFIENTIPSMRAAFDYGADGVELDVHLTTDSVFAVFHDWRVDCQTDGQGVTREQSYAQLSKLDLGYGFTSDGKTYPLRGSGIGLMPTLDTVFDANLPGRVLVNFKSDDETEGQQFLKQFQGSDRSIQPLLFGVYGGNSPTRVVVNGMNGVRGFGRASLKSCLKSYMLVGWLGYVPKACRNTLVAVPLNYAPFIWGWPHKFTQRMRSVNTDVILWGPYDGTGFSSGIDKAETLARVPYGFNGYVWTDRIEIIGPLVKNKDTN